jgi:hypothetical protein
MQDRSISRHRLKFVNSLDKVKQLSPTRHPGRVRTCFTILERSCSKTIESGDRFSRALDIEASPRRIIGHQPERQQGRETCNERSDVVNKRADEARA